MSKRSVLLSECTIIHPLKNVYFILINLLKKPCRKGLWWKISMRTPVLRQTQRLSRTYDEVAKERMKYLSSLQKSYWELFSVRWRVRHYPASSSLQAEQSLKSWLAVFPLDMPYKIHCIRTDRANTLHPVSTHLRLNIPIGFVEIYVWDFVLLVSTVHALCFSHATIAK